MSVHRRNPLHLAPARGRLIVAHQVLEPTRAALLRSRGPDGRHEALVLWLGRTVGPSTLVVATPFPTPTTARSTYCAASTQPATRPGPRTPSASVSSPRFTVTPEPTRGTPTATTP